MNRTQKFALGSFLFNLAYGLYHVVSGIITESFWFFTIGVYYVILSAVRFVALKHKGEKRFILRFAGTMLMLLTLPLVGTVILATVKDRGVVFHIIVMIAIAAYTFTKITIATVNWIKTRKNGSAKLTALRSISFADAVVSVFALQRSMLVSFEGMTETEICIMNVATGTAVTLAVFLLGLNLLKKGRKKY
ncbi:MAG: hypothetical protein IKV98_08060 [Clostridia bacterium]|nr:hypothetical protein [Clostridia bacterium]